MISSSRIIIRPFGKPHQADESLPSTMQNRWLYQVGIAESRSVRTWHLTIFPRRFYRNYIIQLLSGSESPDVDSVLRRMDGIIVYSPFLCRALFRRLLDGEELENIEDIRWEAADDSEPPTDRPS